MPSVVPDMFDSSNDQPADDEDGLEGFCMGEVTMGQEMAGLRDLLGEEKRAAADTMGFVNNLFKFWDQTRRHPQKSFRKKSPVPPVSRVAGEVHHVLQTCWAERVGVFVQGRRSHPSYPRQADSTLVDRAAQTPPGGR